MNDQDMEREQPPHDGDPDDELEGSPVPDPTENQGDAEDVPEAD